MTDTPSRENLIAAIDLGSNSFHMVLAEQFQGEFRILDKRGEKVRLAAGLDENGHLSLEAQERGWECLRGFAQHISGLSESQVTVLATNALRVAKNRDDFIVKAEEILGYPIEVIAGREEARLVYLGVCHSLSNEKERRLVVDIGGGSTEFIIGEKFDPIKLESLHMGCVSYTQYFFDDGVITKKSFKQAIKRAEQELLNIKASYQAVGWQEAIGSSGTIRAVENVGVEQGWSEEGITQDSLKNINQIVLDIGNSDDLDLPGLKPDRKRTFVAGLAIVNAIFNTFNLKKMRYSDAALREGALWDFVGRSQQEEDVRERTVKAMQERFHVDIEQSNKVRETVLHLVASLQNNSQVKFTDLEIKRLAWAADLYEIGLSISHSQFQKHGAYLIEHGDMLGFTKQGQKLIGFLIRSHRRKFPKEEFDLLNKKEQKLVRKLSVILRMAVLLNHSRKGIELTSIELKEIDNGYELITPKGWLDNYNLIQEDLISEMHYLSIMGIELLVRDK